MDGGGRDRASTNDQATVRAESEPYRGADREQQLRGPPEVTLAVVEDLLPRTPTSSPGRVSCPIGNVDRYVTIRVNGQIHGYYRAQADKYRDHP